MTRFAPSPTGMLHIGNARTAIINLLFTRKMNGKFMLRIDDTDLERSREEFTQGIIEDLKWLGFEWDIFERQSNRLSRYNEVKDLLIKSGRLYPCFETPEELDMKRKLSLQSNRPPIYDRAALKATKEKQEIYIKEGRKPHYRFLLKDEEIKWNDIIKGNLSFQGVNLSDPIVIREDGAMTYMLCSVIDDIDFKVSHIIRGEDHISNTAVQIQMFMALTDKLPEFAHLALVQAKEGKISKRVGGFEIKSIREAGIEAISMINLLSTVGSSRPVTNYTNISEIIDNFDINSFSRSPTSYSIEELERVNHKVISSYEFQDVRQRLDIDIDENFWLAIRSNLNTLQEAKLWSEICKPRINKPHELDKELDEKFAEKFDIEYLNIAASLFPEGTIDENTWSTWTKKIQDATGRKGKELFMHLRLAITGMEAGPELQKLLPLIGRDEIIRRLKPQEL